MTGGLEKIIREIERNAAQVAERILTDAQAEAEKILLAAEIEAEAQAEVIAEEARAEARHLVELSASEARLTIRKQLLALKAKVIDEAIAHALVQLRALPADRYFAAIASLIRRYAEPKPGEILFSPEDKARLPESFAQEIVAFSALRISAETRAIDGGVVLKYGEIEENCAFAALFEASHEALQDTIGSILFKP